MHAERDLLLWARAAEYWHLAKTDIQCPEWDKYMGRCWPFRITWRSKQAQAAKVQTEEEK